MEQADNITPSDSVTIDMPADTTLGTISTVNPQQPSNENQAQTQQLSTSNPQEKVEEKNPVGRPCEYCNNKETIDKKTKEYIELGKGEKPRILFLNELAMRLDKHRETIMEWGKKKNEDGSLEHEEFSDMIKTVEQLQELRLQQRILGRYNPSGAIFLLKTKHGYIESEKRIVAGDAKEPLEIIITEDRKYAQ